MKQYREDQIKKALDCLPEAERAREEAYEYFQKFGGRSGVNKRSNVFDEFKHTGGMLKHIPPIGSYCYKALTHLYNAQTNYNGYNPLKWDDLSTRLLRLGMISSNTHEGITWLLGEEGLKAMRRNEIKDDPKLDVAYELLESGGKWFLPFTVEIKEAADRVRQDISNDIIRYK